MEKEIAMGASEASTRGKLVIRLITVVWGAEFVDLFLRVGIRSLLAAGNLPDLARAHHIIYTIYVTPEDARLLEAAPAFVELRKAVDVRLSPFALGEIDPSNAGSHGILWMRGLELARRNGEVLFLIVPDLLYAEGTLMRWASKFEQGFGAVYTPGPFTTLETILPEIESRFPQSGTPISVKPDEIPALIGRHLHPLEAAMMRDAPHRVLHPEHDIRAVARRGFIIRAYTSQPFCIDPKSFNSIRNFNPQDHLDRACYEPCTTTSIEPLFKSAGWYYRPWCLDGRRINQLGAWWEAFAIPGCIEESRHVYDFCLVNDGMWQEERARVVASGRYLRQQALAAMRLYQVWHYLVSLGHYWSTAFLALGVGAAKLRRRLQIRPGAILLAPEDNAFGLDNFNIFLPKIVPGHEHDLIRLIKEHIIIPTVEGGSAPSWRTANGTPANSPSLDAKVIGSPHFVEGFTVCVVDRILVPPSSLDSREEHPERAAVSPPVSQPNRSLLSDPVTLSRRVVRKMRRLAGAGVRSIEPLLNRAMRRLGDRDRLLRGGLYVSRNVFRRAYLVLEPVPILGTLAGRVRKALIIVEREGWLGIESRINKSNGRSARGLRYLYELYRRVPIWLGVFYRAARFTRQFGLAATRSRVWQRLGEPMLFWKARTQVARPLVSASVLATFGEVRLARSLQTMSRLLSHFEKTALPDNMKSKSLDFVRSKLALLGIDDLEVNSNLERHLTALTANNRRWSECWLESGFLALDQGNRDKAAECFTRAAAGKRLSDVMPSDRNPIAVAHAESGRLLAKQGRLKEAEAAYASSFRLEPEAQRIVHLEFGDVLWQLGKWQDAGRHYRLGMVYDTTSYPMKKNIRDAASLSFESLTNPNHSQSLEL